MGSVRQSPDNLGAPSVLVLAKSSVQVGNAGAAGNTELATYTMPAGTMGANDTLRITTLWSCDNTGNTKSAVIYFGDTANDVFFNNCSNEVSLQAMTMIHASNSLTAQKSYGKFQTEGMSFRENTDANESLAIDTTADVDIGFRAEDMTVSENLNLESYTIELIRG